MIYTQLTNRAMKIAYSAHHGQVDKSGQPYIFHPYHLAEQMPDEITICVALLHDVMEDTPITMKQLECEFPKEVTEALRLLTHDEETDYFEYIQAVKENSVARRVKLADLAHNADQTRFAGSEGIEEEKLSHWREKYAKAKSILESEES